MKFKFVQIIGVAFSLTTIAGVSHAIERESGGRPIPPLMDSKAQVQSVLSQVTDESSQITSIQKIENLHYVVEYVDQTGTCNARGFLLSADATPPAGSFVSYTAVTDQLRRSCQ